MWEDFKKFAFKGNVLDLAIAVVIGAAFGAVVNSVVKDIIMPILGFITAGIDFSSLKIVLAPATVANGKEVAETAITYGVLIQTIIQFLLIAFSVFLMVRMIVKAQARMEARKAVAAEQAAAAAEAVAVKNEETILLEEIRDLIKVRNGI